MPSPQQLGQLVQSAKDWTLAHLNSSTQAATLLLSAWNEFDEGHFIGCVLPEFGGCERLQAIGAVLKPAKAALAL
jgi:hypothetical protein